jgi:hypothetical protein
MNTFLEELQRHANQDDDYSTLDPPLLSTPTPLSFHFLSHLKKGLSFEKIHSRYSMVPKEPPENVACSFKRLPEMAMFPKEVA